LSTDYLAWLESALARLREEPDASALATLLQEAEWQAPPPSLVPLHELLEEALACRRLLQEPMHRDPERQQELQGISALLERSVRKSLDRLQKET
jgi:hypothetical protein